MDPFTLSRAVMDLIAEAQGRPPDVDEMARRLGVEPEEVRRELRWLENQGTLLPAPRRPAAVGGPGGRSRVRLFICHASDDAALAKAVVDLFVMALRLPSAMIRCSSVPGYTLDGGDEIDAKLRKEVYDADAFIGIISARALRRLYVTFELGARWGSRRQLVPLLAHGLDPEHVGGPLNGLMALRVDAEEDLHHLITQVARSLAIEPQPVSVYLSALHALRTWRDPALA
jgi:hypothetical protein